MLEIIFYIAYLLKNRTQLKAQGDRGIMVFVLIIIAIAIIIFLIALVTKKFPKTDIPLPAI